MRFVEQTKLMFPRGDCVRAAYASIFGVPLSAVPDFSPAVLKGKNQLEAEREWLRGLGFDLVVVSARGKDRPSVPPHVCHLVSGLSPRGYGHRCVGRGGELVWDPHPSHLGLVETWSYGFLVPLLDPTEEVAAFGVAGSGAELLGFSGWC